jgi:hypothetical protein
MILQTVTITTCNAKAAGFFDGVTFGVCITIGGLLFAVRRNFTKKDN